MTQERAQVVVIGLGAMGSAVCDQLASRGADVIGFDQFSVPSERGSSHGESRIIRMCYFEHPDYVPLLKRAYEHWHALNVRTGRPVLEITSGLFIGPPECELVAGSKRAADAHGLPHEMLSNSELMRNWPQFAVRKDMIALVEPTGGLLRPELAIESFARLAQANGARLHDHEAVVSWRAERDHVVVQTAARAVRAKSLIITAGAWSSRLIGELNPMLRVSRQVMAWIQPKQPEQFALGTFPIWAMEHPCDNRMDFHYGFPSLDCGRTIKVARHHPGETIDPDRRGDAAQPADEDEVRPFVERYVPNANGELRAMKLCMYTNSPTGHFIVDRHPVHANVFFAAGFSGHGFKFAPVMGEALADLALNGTTSLPVDFLCLNR